MYIYTHIEIYTKPRAISLHFFRHTAIPSSLWRNSAFFHYELDGLQLWQCERDGWVSSLSHPKLSRCYGHFRDVEGLVFEKESVRRRCEESLRSWTVGRIMNVWMYYVSHALSDFCSQVCAPTTIMAGDQVYFQTPLLQVRIWHLQYSTYCNAHCKLYIRNIHIEGIYYVLCIYIYRDIYTCIYIYEYIT